MSEGHGDPPADVRSFLPRPGEPVERYAERLRALHRDLTLVLQAVERGLAAAAQPEDLEPPVPAHRPIEIVPRTAEGAPPAAAPSDERRTRMPRVEVMPAPGGDHRGDEQEDRRAPPAPPEPGAEPDPQRSNGPGPGAGAVPRPAHFPARPSAVSHGPAAEPEWVERGEGFTAPTFPPTRTKLQIPPLLVTGFVLAWLVVVGLLVALLLS